MAVKKTSISFTPAVWDGLSQYKNKSKIVNEALALFFSLEQRRGEKELEISNAEEEILLREWEKYKKTGEFFSYKETFSRTQ